jgi:hypothetical protein
MLITKTKVESRLNQSNSRTQVTIAEETKRDSMAMKTIAALTMLFLPGTFTAVSLLEPSKKFDQMLMTFV